ncbi:MAG: TetR/AcrR family transcriptional regulator [Eubacteriales bacterium]|nr:TetR/AcrR family transcriptional regulator [Eubacteriales bacterium]
MSNKGRNAYVIEHITKAMLALLEEKTMEEISVSELVEKAQVGRASFYRNFTSREDVVKQCFDAHFTQWAGEPGMSSDEPLSQRLRLLISHFEQNRPFYELLNKRGLIFLFKDAIVSMVGLKPESSPAEAYSKAFAAYALYGWIETWFQRGMQDSADEIAALFQTAGL